MFNTFVFNSVMFNGVAPTLPVAESVISIVEPKDTRTFLNQNDKVITSLSVNDTRSILTTKE